MYANKIDTHITQEMTRQDQGITPNDEKYLYKLYGQ